MPVTDPSSCITGVKKNNKASDIAVYPNPFNDFLFIKAPLIGNFEILTLEGKVVMQGNNTFEGELIKVNLVPGVYVLKFFAEGSIYVKLIVRQ